MTHDVNDELAFPGLVDLAAERLGGIALAASDEFFAEKENMIKPGRGIFIPDKYTDRGKWMDGWESRRKRGTGHDWCIIKLGAAGIIRIVDVDTNHFLGNNPAYASIEACVAPTAASGSDLQSENLLWHTVVPFSWLRPGSHNLLSVSSGEPWSHVRLNIFPDGGVARFRVFCKISPQWDSMKSGDLADLALITNGGTVVACSDMFFSQAENLIMPGQSRSMADGWETRRKRGPGHDWVIIQLGREVSVRKVEVDTTHFKGNYPDRCSLEVCSADSISALNWHEGQWRLLLPETRLKGNFAHLFEKELQPSPSCTHIKLNIFPDGGVSRLRIWGDISSHVH